MNLRWLIVIPLVAFIALAALFYRGLNIDTETLPSALIGKPMPDFELTELYNKTPLTKASVIGEPALLNVWATWCPSCKVEHPMLNALAEAGVKIIGLNYKDHDGKAAQWLQSYGDPYAVNVYDPEGRLGFDLGVYGAPETYLLNAQGQIVKKHVGVVDQALWAGEFGEMYRELVAAHQRGGSAQ